VIPARRALAWIYFVLMRAQGTERRLLRKVRTQERLVVLNLHQVRPTPNPFWSPLHPALFEELLRFVARHFFVTTFERCHENDSGRPPLILSFDDGYHDYLEYAVPLLRKYRLPSNQNVTGDSMLTGRPPAVVRLCDFLAQAPRALIDEIRLPGLSLRLQGDGLGDKARFADALFQFVKMRPRAAAAPAWAAIDTVIAKLDAFRPSRMMTVAEVRQVAGEHEIGAHSYGHDSMEFEDDAFFEQDLSRCQELFRDTLRLPLRVYAFANGSHRPEQIQILRSRGVAHVLLVGGGYALPGAGVYPRFTFHADSPSEARLRALGYTTEDTMLRRTVRRISAGSAAGRARMESV
jgi:peptidoglycan/xylan/chitin deacetylase (PgdA/CDA1 family)